MTAQQLLDNALALLLTSSAQTPEYTVHAVALINMLLGEIGPYNEMICKSKNKEPQSALRIESLNDVLPCEEALSITALPNGLCAKLLMDDDDMAKVAYFQNQYIAAAQAAAQCVAEHISDVYPNGGGA